MTLPPNPHQNDELNSHLIDILTGYHVEDAVKHRPMATQRTLREAVNDIKAIMEAYGDTRELEGRKEQIMRDFLAYSAEGENDESVDIAIREGLLAELESTRRNR